MANISVPQSLDSTVELNDGFKMPMFGLGVYKMEDDAECAECVNVALSNGYKMIDTAEMYKNEEGVGRGLKKSGLKREDYFVVTKLMTFGHQPATNAFKQSLKKLGLEFVDLYLIHTPRSSKAKILDSYRAMIELQKKGLIRSIGVSNFGVKHLEILKEEGLPTPAVNQIELHPFQHHKDIVEYCRANNIAVMGYSPLGKGKRLDDPDLLQIANKYQKTVPELCIRWSVQNGFITIPKSVNHQRIIDNTHCFDWSITDDDMRIILELPQWSCMSNGLRRVDSTVFIWE
ncbi:unnamed protein product [Owenia fusiformis]|uniref:NADP-dependent oxidoreductase domain-containing protein n=1 Tax=Owenia fusiformis TaxID=6347 RepID=A0A8J1U725_OWEFU|nr:unnamed protein product [Owenia fusiformis]